MEALKACGVVGDCVEGCGIVGDCVGGSCEDSDVGIEGFDDGVDSAALFSNMSLNA